MENVKSCPTAGLLRPAFLGDFSNYCGVLCIWDRVFGTHAEEEEEEVDYGLVKQLQSSNIVWINFHEYASMVKDVRHAQGLRNKFLYLIKEPGWKPADSDDDNGRSKSA